MVTVILSIVPQGLRGHLTRWLCEVSTGVYVGKVNARLRKALWAIITEQVKDGRALMIVPSASAETGFEIWSHNPQWELVDCEGLVLPMRPATRPTPAKKGWSNASRRRRSRKRVN